ncbi:DNase I-like protein [Xylariaceae sp. FL1272]|nr:DNase I-like protein [Xylariaceae sp. FL1272]
MGLRITSWNVNGIRNPFGYQPWSDKKTFEAMFDILEADIVVMQETKIQRKDLRDDMVLVPGWDVFFSLPRTKKGYAGVAIYTRNSVCAPIKAEEGITGSLCPPNSTTSFRDLPEDQRIGGYPRLDQMTEAINEDLLDSEGRCVILEFPAFVLIGTYSPATRDETRDNFRIGYNTALDARVRNLIAMEKRVVLTGDLNIVRDTIDTANLAERLKKESMSIQEFFAAPTRRLFNHLVFEGKVQGPRDEDREKPVLWDLGRLFHPTREGMFTCWEVKKNHRPGNFGSRIDYVLCSDDMKGWFVDSNIQEGLMGSDHCPVYATLADTVQFNGADTHAMDIMNPPGVFKDGRRLRDWSNKDLLPLSAKLIPEFDRRRSIKDMFKKPTAPKAAASQPQEPRRSQANDPVEPPSSADTTSGPKQPLSINQPSSPLKPGNPGLKRAPSGSASSSKATKKPKASLVKEPSGKGQSSLMGFFKPKDVDKSPKKSDGEAQSQLVDSTANGFDDPIQTSDDTSSGAVAANNNAITSTPGKVFDPVQNKESWSKLLGKRVVPKCEHDEDCISLTTKKAGMNKGRAFFICPRPIGPSGEKEKGTQWRCGTFIWSSDWNYNNNSS